MRDSEMLEGRRPEDRPAARRRTESRQPGPHQPRVLAIFAHPDDETFICGGTMARLALEGARITLVTATLGEMGRRLGQPAYATRETLPVLREKELREACGALGIADLRLLGLRDKTVDYYDPTDLAGRIRAIMRDVSPDVAITFHEAIGGHPDHCAIGRAATLAWEAWRSEEEKRAPGEKRAAEARLYYVLWHEYADQLKKVEQPQDRVTSVRVQGEAAEARVRAFRAHRTQSQMIEWLWDDAKAREKLIGQEYLLQGSGPARPGETWVLP
ncbi:MAG: PIG-L family deacetylase [Bacillota bacterium]